MAERGALEHDRFKAIYDAHYPAVLRYAARRVGAEAARDIAAETFLTAWRRLDRVPPGQPLPWLCATARKCLADELRRLVRARHQHRHRRHRRRARRLPSPLNRCHLGRLRLPQPVHPERTDQWYRADGRRSRPLSATVGASMAHVQFLSAATARYPAVVLGTEAANLLGIRNLARPI
ncbi:MAG TPA: sigma-70 family RNA polymerase sigma factor [Streptosporangiaceae bacterium]